MPLNVKIHKLCHFFEAVGYKLISVSLTEKKRKEKKRNKKKRIVSVKKMKKRQGIENFAKYGHMAK